jgi:uncharacterized protein (TIGR00106 family)
MVLVEFSIFPVGKEEHLSNYVAHSLEIIERSGLPYQITSMGTLIEGEWDDVMNVVTDCYLRMQEEAPRIYCTMKIDARKEGGPQIKRKIESVEQKVGHKLTK